VFEKLDLKLEIFKKLDAVAPPRAMLASNTSAISISTLAASTQRPDRVLGIHFFSPVPMMEAVEVVRGQFTSDEVFADGKAFVEAIGKEPILVIKRARISYQPDQLSGNHRGDAPGGDGGGDGGRH
jgi:3-hydroxybutyryl-CoA dehydrogenase